MAGGKRCWLFQLLTVSILILAVTTSAQNISRSIWTRSPSSKVVVFLREICYEDGDALFDDPSTGLIDYMTTKNLTRRYDMQVTFLTKEAVCESRSRGLSAILDALSQDSTKALIGSVEEDLCDVTSRLADMWGKPLLSWSCPQVTRGTQRLVPSLEETANAIVGVSKNLFWKSIIIITSDVGWWPVLANKVEVGLQEIGVAPRHIYWENDVPPIQALRALRHTPAKVIILCSSLRSNTGEVILKAIDELKLSQAILLAIDVSSFVPFLPRIVTKKKETDDEAAEYKMQNDEPSYLEEESEDFDMVMTDLDDAEQLKKFQQAKDALLNMGIDYPSIENRSSESGENKLEVNKTEWLTVNRSEENATSMNFADRKQTNWTSAVGNNDQRGALKQPKLQNRDHTLTRKKRSWLQHRYELFDNISLEMKKSFVILTSMDSKDAVTNEFAETTTKNELFEHIIEGLNTIVTNSGPLDNKTVKVFKFLFLDWKEKIDDENESSDSHWRPLVILQSTKNLSSLKSKDNVSLMKVQPNFDAWFTEKGLKFDEDSCDDDFCIRAQIKMNSTHIIIIVISALLISLLSIGIIILLRNFLLKRRLSKGPNKIVLTATDFVFPQVPDSRRVDEGIEAMLCCWLQQLQEFGGPEVEKPDLLKGSVGSLKGPGNAKGPSSNGSLAKNNYIIDHRIRYNGDFVQVKELPIVGTFELKSKAMDCLLLTHGLRHENLNPLIGCLTDPARPALVHEYCSRGSLEDVLMMDEIKLDWTFRLSLLTDLVRGMRYLHQSPLKVHGYLTSRNCVIDARWVLKVTDYGLPTFYEAQGIPPPAKNARDLLWSAPELLRHCGLRRRGTQPGDVYSFGIIMQEVVVRGEPFCMLALSPEEIIEKVKKPPPLIRPSVSKGAAPPEAIHIMRQCWTEQPEMRPDFCQVHDLFRKLNQGRKVNFVDTMFQMLEKYSNNLEELIRERTEQLDMEKKKTEQLLNRMLPSYVAEKLKLGMPVDPEEFSEVSIYFSDIVGFTQISAHCTPFQVVDLLNDLYTCFDATINAYNVYKVETIGDAYMVVGGLPVKTPDHAEQIATMALDLLHQSGRFKIRHLPKTPLHLRIGLHTGPCCAGVVGLTMPRYCLFGDTVNTASRMESTGSAWRIHISQATRDKLVAAGGYSIEFRGRTEVKGKGKMPTYWLLGKAGFDKPLPSPPPIGFEESLSRSPSTQTAEGPTETVSITVSNESATEKQNGHHFSIDKSLFSVENCTTSPIKITNNNTNNCSMEAKSNNRDKSPLSDELCTTIPTITTGEFDDDSQNKFDQICKAEPTSSTTVFSNHHLTLTSPVSASDVASVLLGSSTSLINNRYKDVAKYKRSLFEAPTDISSPYNHYKCLSPSESNISHLGKFHGGGSDSKNAGRLLKRQFSLDRADDSNNAIPESNLAAQSSRPQQRLSKQNSAGAAPDLERIEEVPLAVIASPMNYKRRLETSSTLPGASKSISSESLSNQPR